MKSLCSLILLLGLCLLAACGGGSQPASTGNGSGDGVNPSTNWDPADFTSVYEVGPGRTYADPNQVPWENLQPSSLVLIYYRDTPYRCKWVINVSARVDAPLVVLGVADNGRRPVISGDAAVTRQSLDYWNENRSVIKIGGSSLPDNPAGPAHIVLQGLEIHSARPAYSFTDDSGQPATYSDNAAAVHIEQGSDIRLVDCVLRDSGNGLFSSSASVRLTISGNHIYDNGISGSIYQHNSYTESRGITFEYNHYGPLRAGCLGNNIKDRSSGTVIRYNWIEGGNRQLDLVETDDPGIAADPEYLRSFVYGNLLIEPDGAGNSQIIHYGGDGGNTSMYRQGTLYFYHNTLVSTRRGNTSLLRLSNNQVSAELFNNLLYTTAGGSFLAVSSGFGQIQLHHNWLPTGWQLTHEASLDSGATVTDLGNIVGNDPGFVYLPGQDFHLSSGAAALGQAGSLPADVAGLLPDRQYLPHQSTEPRSSQRDIGAFEI